MNFKLDHIYLIFSNYQVKKSVKVLVISIKDILKAVCIIKILYIFIRYVQLNEYIYFQLLAVTVVIKKNK